MTIQRRGGAITIKDIEALDAEPIVNFVRRRVGKLDRLLQLVVPGWLGSSKITRGEGKPDIVMRGYEACPGAWLYDDLDTGIGFVVYSDGWKKNPWKGSSIEVVLNGGNTGDLPDAFERLLKRLVLSSAYYGFAKPGDLRAFVEDGQLAVPARRKPAPGG